MTNKPIATENDINESNNDSTSDLERKMMIVAQEMDLINQRLDLQDKQIDLLMAGLELHRHSPSGEAMFPMRKE